MFASLDVSATRHPRHAAYPAVSSFIDGTWASERAARYVDVLDPATGTAITTLPLVETSDLDRALAAANRAFATWRKVPAIERTRLLLAAADLMRQRLDRIAHALVLEQGKTIAGARFEVGAAIESLEWHAEEARRIYGRVIPARAAGVQHIVTRVPIGVVAAFTPWNFPALTPMRKIAGALAAGCTLLIKGAEESPGTLVEMVRCLDEAGLPPGVLNLVFGEPAEVSTHVLASPIVKKLSITGSTPVGKQLGKLAMDRLIKTTMELGGHAPVLVCADVDPQKVVDLVAPKKLLSSGQNCISPTRFYVERRIYGDFVARLVAWAKAVKVGDPLDPSMQMGPVSNARRLAAIERLIRDSVDAGARIVAGGKRIAGPGFFHELTVLADVPDHAPAMQEEPFGPIMLVTAFDTIDEAIARANALPYGLAGYAFTASEATANRIAEDLDVGMLGLNQMQVSLAEAPFGGVKESGIGRENGTEGLDAYLVDRFIARGTL